jgi:plasmid stabilization system protein ParE
LKIRYADAALRELRRATRYYGAAAPRLGDRFVDAVDETLLRIRKNPLAGTPITGGRRRLNVKGFPYSLFAEVWAQERFIVVLAVAHQKRKPGYWRARKRPT